MHYVGGSSFGYCGLKWSVGWNHQDGRCKDAVHEWASAQSGKTFIVVIANNFFILFCSNGFFIRGYTALMNNNWSM